MIQIEVARAEEGQTLAKFNALAFARNPDFDPDIIVDWTHSSDAVDYFNNVVANDYCLVARDNDEIVGYLSATPKNHPHRSSNYLEIVNLGVHPDYRRRGVASNLVSRCESWAREQGFTRLELTCYSRNEEALAYYDHMGFETVHKTLEKAL